MSLLNYEVYLLSLHQFVYVWAYTVCVCVRQGKRKKMDRSVLFSKFFSPPFWNPDRNINLNYSTSTINSRDLEISVIEDTVTFWLYIRCINWAVQDSCRISFLIFIQWSTRIWCFLAVRRGEWKATELEHYVKMHSYQVSSLTSGCMLITDYSPRQCSDKHTRGSSYTVILIPYHREEKLGVPILDAFTSNRIDISCMIT